MAQGPPNDSYEMAYAVHTSTCTYLLDELGVCRWVVSPTGTVPSHIRQCIGAQFVACLDLRVPGALTGELAPGAHALLVRHDGLRMAMLRTGPIERVDDRRAPQVDPADTPPPAAAVRPSPYAQYGKQPGGLHSARPPPHFGVVKHAGEEATVTVNFEAQAGDMAETATTKRPHPGQFEQDDSELTKTTTATPRQLDPDATDQLETTTATKRPGH